MLDNAAQALIILVFSSAQNVSLCHGTSNQTQTSDSRVLFIQFQTYYNSGVKTTSQPLEQGRIFAQFGTLRLTISALFWTIIDRKSVV